MFQLILFSNIKIKEITIKQKNQLHTQGFIFKPETSVLTLHELQLRPAKETNIIFQFI